MILEHSDTNKKYDYCAECGVDLPEGFGRRLTDPHQHLLCHAHWFERISTSHHLISFEKRPSHQMRCCC